MALVVALAGTAALTAGPTTSPASGEPTAEDATPSPVTPVLSARRLPGVLAASQAASRTDAALAPILAQATATTCVTVSSGNRVIERTNGDLPVMPASTEKLLTATAVLTSSAPTPS